MHTFAIKEKSRTGGFGRRYFLHADLPNNPVCWLFGHRPHVRVTRYGRGPHDDLERTNVWVECRVCGLRWTSPYREAAVERDRLRGTVDWKDRERELKQRLIENGPPEGARGRDGYGHSRLELGAELYAYKPTKLRLREGWGFRLHIGGRGSETPLDAHVEIPVFAGYFKVGGIGGRWCEFIGRGHKRDISLSVHGGSLWWKLWHDDDGGYDETAHRCDPWRRPPWPWSLGRHKARQWMCLRNGHIPLNPVSLWTGTTPVYDHDRTGPEREAFVDVGQFPGDRYLVRFRREPWQRHRRHGWPRWTQRVLERGESLHWDAGPIGIPVRNHDWKGDETISSSGPMPKYDPLREDWLPAAVEQVRQDVIADRARYGYRPRERTVEA